MVRGRMGLPDPFSLGLTLLCGQCFRWDGPDLDGWFQGVAGGLLWRLRQRGRELEWGCGPELPGGFSPEGWLTRYLGLDDDLGAWERDWAGHPVLGKPLEQLRGLRLLRQEPWECLASYMFAQGLSVKVIRQALAKFCGRFGNPIPGAPGFQAFPLAPDIARLSPGDLRPFTNNYWARADRIIRAARALESGVLSLEYLKGIPCDEARSALMSLDGIGPKIADCVLLFSLDQGSAFPVDRWVLRAMQRHFRSVQVLGRGREVPGPGNYGKIVGRARKAFGERCGLASEYLFLYLRLKEDRVLAGELAPYCGPEAPGGMA